jgi:phosphatidylserine/phosphatidylglycerophosphate/cardiolipin synthase-like enzyme
LAPEAAAFSLLDALSETGFQSSVIATYCCYFPFYEEVVLRRLLNRGCTNNVLMVDAKLCAQAFASEHARPRRAGRDYTLVPIDLDGAFHPKLIVAVGKAKGALFVGSHNATLAGFGLNDEITNEFRTSGPGARQGTGVIRAALDYLQGFTPKTLPDVAHVFSAARRNVPWLEGPVAVEWDERILLFTTGRDADLWSRLRPFIPKRPALTFVCGPFFDKKLEFLQRLIDDVKPRRLVVGIDPDSVEIDPHVVRKFRGAEFVNVAGLAQVPNRRESGARYLHAKVLWFSGGDEELLVTGSANPSKAAFLSTRDWRNAEVIVADRRAGAATALGLDRVGSAPRLQEKDWAQVARRQAERAHEERDASGTMILAVPSYFADLAPARRW